MPKRYFVFDASALVFKYLPSQDRETAVIKNRLNELFLARTDNPKSLIFQIPNICMAECGKTFAKACFEWNLYGLGNDAHKAYEYLRKALLDDVSRDRIINSFELKRDHFVGIEEIFARDYHSLPRPNPKKKGRRLSPNDVLIISMARWIGLNLADGLENAKIITAENRMESMCHKFPEDYPKAINIRREDIEPYLEG